MIANALRLLAALALVACSVFGAAVAQTAGAAAEPVKPGFPSLALADAQSSGARAVELLGDRLGDVAAYYGRTEVQLRALLIADSRLRVDRNGRLFVVDDLPSAEPFAEAPVAGPSSALDGKLAPLDQTFLLHSRPGAKRTIYLNFRGATLTNTAWGPNTTLIARPFDLDGIPNTFTTAELERIQYIWQRVVEDFAPYEVDVTTEPPPPDRLTRSSTADDVYGTTVLITHRGGVYNCSCGGVAYIGVFDNVGDFYKPALVFYDALGGGSEKAVAEAISHEAGHNLGLLHDGAPGVGYYSGHGSGATGWAPIMGVGYSRNLVQWSKGEYAGANNTEDDLAVMTANGLPVRADDHGNANAQATPLRAVTAGGVTTLSGEGVIERPADIDVFSFTAAGGVATLTLKGAARSSNLDALLELRNAAGTVLASANPVDALDATVIFTLPAAGTYYLWVHGVGKGDPRNGGYSDYGSLGQYALTGTVQAGVGQPPVAAMTATPQRGTAPLTVNFSASGSQDPDGSIQSYAWSFGDGSAGSGVNVSHVYANAGSFVARLTVTDNSGMTATRTLTITVDPRPANQPPVADPSATPLRGTAPLTVAFSGAGSRDPDGSITEYAWVFGNGKAGSGISTSTVYDNAGTYTATLTVKDNAGATASKSLTITVDPKAVTPTVSVGSIDMSLQPLQWWPIWTTARAVVTVRDANGLPVAGARVSGRWTGVLAIDNAVADTGADGKATLATYWTMSPGVFTFTVTSVARAGYNYDASKNAETSDSIRR